MPTDDLAVSLRRLSPAEVRAFHDGAHLALTWALSLLPNAVRIPGSPTQPAEVLAAFRAVHDEMTMSALMATYCPADTEGATDAE